MFLECQDILTVEQLRCSTICRPKISPPKVIYEVQSMPYKSLPLGAFWTIFGRNIPTGVLQLLYPYQPANPLVESIFKALKFVKFLNILNFFGRFGEVFLHEFGTRNIST